MESVWISIALSILIFGVYIRFPWLSPLEKLAYWLFSNIVQKLTFTIITLNLGMAVLEPRYTVFFTVHLVSLFIISVLYPILVSLYWLKRFDLFTKLASTVVIIGGMVLIDYWLFVTKQIHLITWNIVYSLGRYSVMLIIIWCFSILFRRLLAKARELV